MKLSVIIPVYNVEGDLPQCLTSVLGQGFDEVICVDDGSTDGSGAILDAAAAKAPELKVIHQTNHGTLMARKAAVKASTGDWCLFLDPDDWLEPKARETLVERLAATTANVVGYGFNIHTDARTERLQPMLERQFNAGAVRCTSEEAFTRIYVRQDIPAHLIGKVVRGDLCRRIFEAQPDIHALFQEDIYACFLLVADCESLEMVPDRLYNYRVGDGISYRDGMPLETFRRSFSRLELLRRLKYFVAGRYPEGGPAQTAFRMLERRMVKALISQAIERVVPVSARREAVAEVIRSCSRGTLSTALAEWYTYKCDRFLATAADLGLADFTGEMALRQAETLGRRQDRELAALKQELAALKQGLEAQRRALAALNGEILELKKKGCPLKWVARAVLGKKVK